MPVKDGDSGPAYQWRAVNRVIDTLEALMAGECEFGLSAIAQQAHLPKPTAFRILAILEQRGYVRRADDKERYRVGLQAFKLGSHYLKGLTLRDIAYPRMKRLAGQFSNCVTDLAICEREYIVILDIVQNAKIPLYPDHIGMVIPAHCTALGKVLWADIPEAELQTMLGRVELVRMTPHSITDSLALREHLATVRAQGHATDDEEAVVGTLGIGAPIRDRTGAAIAALGIRGVKALVTSWVPEMLAQACLAAGEISTLLGYIPG